MLRGRSSTRFHSPLWRSPRGVFAAPGRSRAPRSFASPHLVASLRARHGCVKLSTLGHLQQWIGSMALTLKSSAFGQEQRIPDRHTCEGDDISPPLSWSGAPLRTRSFALICSDPDAPMKTWYHWAIFDIPATADHLDEGIAAGARVDGFGQAVSDFGRPGYGGPCPPKGHGEHHYRFHLVALDVSALVVAEKAHCRDVERAAAPHVLAEAVLTGIYSR